MSKQADKTNKAAPPKAAKKQTTPVQQQVPVDNHLLQLAREDPTRLTPTQRTQLQRTLGNRTLSRLVGERSSVNGNQKANNQQPAANSQQPTTSTLSPRHLVTLSPSHPVIQTKLTVNAVGDKYEQEADAVAKEVVQKLNTPQPDAAAGVPAAPPTHAQRQTEEEEPIAQRIQRQETPRSAAADIPTAPPTLQRQSSDEEDLQLQRQETEDEELQLQCQELEEEEPQEMAMLQREAAPEEEELQLQRQEDSRSSSREDRSVIDQINVIKWCYQDVYGAIFSEYPDAKLGNSKSWRSLREHGKIDEDINFTTEHKKRHVKLLVNIKNGGGKKIIIAQLVDWLGNIPFEFWRKEGYLVLKNGEWRIIDKEPAKNDKDYYIYDDDEEVFANQNEAVNFKESDLINTHQEQKEEATGNMAMTQRQPQDFSQGGQVNSHIEAQINQSRGGGRPMEDSIRQPMEQAFGADFSDVRIHTDAQAHNLNESIQARAFTTGRDIFFKRSEYNPASSVGNELLAHELTHVIQQTGDIQRQAGMTSPDAPMSVSAPNFNQKQDNSQTEQGKNQKKNQDIQKIESLLRNLPVETPDEAKATQKVLSLFFKLRASAIEGGTSKTLPPIVGLPFNTVNLLKQLQQKQYSQVATTLIAIGGDAASTASWIITAGVELGAFGVTSGIAQTGAVLGFLGEAAGPTGIALGVLFGVASIPSASDGNLSKIYYIVDLSGIITSWIFNDATISPHSQLMSEMKNRGLWGADLTETTRKAHRSAHEIWQDQFSGKPEHIKQVRQSVGGDYRRYWRLLGSLLESHYRPSPSGIALIEIDRFIRRVRKLRDDKRRRKAFRN